MTLVDRGWEEDVRLLQKPDQAPGARADVVQAGRMDLVFPHDDRELKAMNGLAILAASAILSDHRGFPILKLYLSPKKGPMVELPRIFPFSPVLELDPGSPHSQLVGPYRQDVYFLVPIPELLGAYEVVLMLQGAATPLRIGRLPIDIPKNLSLKKLKKLGLPRPNQLSDPRTTLELIRQAFCIDFNR